MNNKKVIGRFAPTPSGLLHMGSLVAALASYFSAKQQEGLWVIRIEDTDIYRNLEGAADGILRQLSFFGLHSDLDIVFQSKRIDIYNEIIDNLLRKRKAYYCNCSRKKMSASGVLNCDNGPYYEGFCRNSSLPSNKNDYSIRFLTEDRIISFTDRVLGEQRQNVENEVGDFVIYRRDGVYSYNFVCTIDDYLQGVTEVVRGEDLLLSTCRQIAIIEELKGDIPEYCHIPIVKGADGRKLGKSTNAAIIDINNIYETLNVAFRHLNIDIPSEIMNEKIDVIYKYIIKNKLFKY